jgi:two-component system CheB/CheR fusion protein
VDDLPGRISPICNAPRWSALRPKKALEDKTQSALEKAIILLRTHTGHDFSLYKKNTFYRRIERRMGIHQIDKIADYVRYLQENSQELDLLFKELLIGVTSFFRDAAVWEELRKKIIPALSPAGPPAMCCGRGCPAAPRGRKPIPWPWCSRRRWKRSSRGRKSRCRFLPPTWTRMRLTRRARASIPKIFAADVSPKQAEPVLYQG